MTLTLATAVLLAASGCATAPPAAPSAGGCPSTSTVAASYYGASPPAPGAVLDSVSIHPEVEKRILALDPERVSEQDVLNTLACGPTPRIMGLHGGIYPVHLAMLDFAGFLVDMGYPQPKIRHPKAESFSHSPYESSARLAGLAAWYYEQEGTRVMLIGHSQGGIQVVKVLHQLDGKFAEAIQAFNPVTGSAEQRTWIVDPLTGVRRPVIGVSVAYASVVGAGGAAFILPNQWGMMGLLRTVPNTTDEFTGFFIAFDIWAWNIPGSAELQRYQHNGIATVRNVSLPAHYNHVTLPAVRHLARDQALREWINAYAPGQARPAPPVAQGADDGLLWVADVWYSIKKHWALEAQRLIRAQRTRFMARDS